MCIISAFFFESQTNQIDNNSWKIHQFSFIPFKQKGREEQCEPDDKEKVNSKNVANLLGVDREQMMKAFCKPKIKVISNS